MGRIILKGALTCLLLAGASSTIAGVYSDDLTKCVVKNATAQDKSDLVRWMFGAISLNPDIKDLVKVTAAQRDLFNEKFVGLMERLLLTDCRPAAVDAAKYEGSSAISESFRVLGDVAGRGMMNDPAASGALSTFLNSLHKDQWAKFSTEAGVDVMGTPGGK